MRKRFHISVRKNRLIFSFLTALFCISFFGNIASAKTPTYSITMTPSSTELSAPPGGNTSSSFAVVNEGTANYTLSVSVSPYHVVGVNYDPQFSVLPGTTDASKWIHLNSPPTQTLASGKVQSISYSLNVPGGTAPGGYYAVIFAEAIPPVNTGVTPINRVGDVLYITVDGPVAKTGNVKPSSLPYIFTGNKLSIGTLVQDTGGLHFLTNVHVTATSLFGHVAFQANLQRYVLPQTQRLVVADWSSLPNFGVYKITRSATVFGQKETLPTRYIIIIKSWVLIYFISLVVIIVGIIIYKRKSKQSKKAKSVGKKKNVRT